jgi:hypothetical protein
MKPVLITTDKDKRGVFFGYIDPKDADKDTIRAERVQMCLYWSEDMRGVLGLAVYGPSSTCRISPAMPSGIIKGVTLVAEVTKEAEKAWKNFAK